MIIWLNLFLELDYAKYIWYKLLIVLFCNVIDDTSNSYNFKNCKQSGSIEIDILNNNFPQELKENYEKQIKHLEEEVVFFCVIF